jgi:hypothetical protein
MEGGYLTGYINEIHVRFGLTLVSQRGVELWDDGDGEGRLGT